MKAIRFHEYGDAGVLRYEDAPEPGFGPDQVLIRIVGAAVNPIDWKVRKGLYREQRPMQLPAIAGYDASGTVEKIGPLVTRFKVGDPVVARVSGAYAEFGVASSDRVSPAPAFYPLAHAAGLPIAAGTAWTVMFDAAQLKTGQTVVIHAAAGGVGSFAVQLAKLAGLNIIACCSAKNADLVRSLGAETIIDDRITDLASVAHNVDLVFDTVGRDAQARSWGVIKKGGKLITIAAPPDLEAAAAHGVTASFERLDLNGARLEEICGLISVGKLKMPIEAEFPLAEARAAQERSEAGHSRGKIILNVPG
jgi:NADPH:quinone reductase-like Zn-dependent oxidoreductase